MDKLELYNAVMETAELLDGVERQAFFTVVLHRLKGYTMKESYAAGNRILEANGEEPVPYPVPKEVIAQ